MRGRDKFNKFRSALILGSKFFGLFPRRIRLLFYKLIQNCNSTIFMAIRYMLLKTLAKKCGNNVSVHTNVYLFNLENISLGDNVSIHPMCYLDASGGIEINNDVSIAHSVTIMSSTHKYDDLDIPIKDQGLTYSPTIINSNVWIGAKATILSGVTIAEGTIVAANAVVNKNFTENLLIGGVPAKTLKTRGV